MSEHGFTVHITFTPGADGLTQDHTVIFDASDVGFLMDAHGRFSVEGTAHPVNGYWGTENGVIQPMLTKTDLRPEAQP